MRKLASIQEITNIQPIPKADRIEVASVLGWKVVVRKGEFKVGDHCVYCEIDSILPDKPEFDFLRDVKFRIKTCRKKKQISQGICFPLDILVNGGINVDSLSIGDEVTEEVGVTKYEMPVALNMSGENKRAFPYYIPKTDEMRIQSEPGLLDEMKGKPCYITEKVDGTSGTFAFRDGEFDVCSRNCSKKEADTNIYWKMYKKYNIEEILKKVGNIAIQGEIAGPGIQKNRLGLNELKLFVFDVYDIDKKEYFGYWDLVDFCAAYNLQMVLTEQEGTFDYSIEQLLEMAKGEYTGTKNPQEGIVIRPQEPIYSDILGGRLSFKVINNESLLKEKQDEELLEINSGQNDEK